MFSSPAKRRRSNSSSAIQIGASNTGTQAGPGPEAQRLQRAASHDVQSPLKRGPQSPMRLGRESFRSPTRASLARSHPDVLDGVIRRSPQKSRLPRPAGRDVGPGKVGGDALTGKTILRPSSTGVGRGGVRSPSPRRLPAVSEEPGANSQSQSQSERRRRINDPSEPSEVAPTTATEPVDPANQSSSSENERHEPDLPPTPTALGLQRVPNRQHRIFNNSPTTRQMHGKQKVQGAFTSSPLKPRDKDQLANVVETEKAGEYKADPALPESPIPKELLEKEALRDGLAAQLSRLKADISLIENEAQRYQDSSVHLPDEESVKDLISLLTTSNPSCAPLPPQPPPPPTLSSLTSFLLPFSSTRFIPKSELRPPSPLPANPFALDQPEDPTPYLTVFAPLSLSAHTVTSTINPSGEASSTPLTQTHELVLSAPAPFPNHVFQVPITFKTDPEKQIVLSISIDFDEQSAGKEGTSQPKIPALLRQWIDTRLANPLLYRDISGLCWGIGRYWEAAVSRARVWAQLENIRPGRDSSSSPSSPSPSQISPEKRSYTPRQLLPHLHRTSILFTIPSTPSTSSTSSKPQLLISCTLALDLWTAEPLLQPDISVSVPSSSNGAKIEREARKVLAGWLKKGRTGPTTTASDGSGGGGAGDMSILDVDGDALVKAVEAVVKIVFGAG